MNKLSSKLKRRKTLFDRDWKLLKLCFDQYFLTRKQMELWLNLHYNLYDNAKRKDVLNKALRMYYDMGFLDIFQDDFFKNYNLYSLTTKGINALIRMDILCDNVEYSSTEHFKLKHDLVATDIRILLEKMFPNSHWISDRIIKPEYYGDLIPDAEINLLNTEGKTINIAVEIELSRKSKFRYKQKFREYLKSDYHFVFYFVQDNVLGSIILEMADAVTCRDNDRDMFITINIADFLIKRHNTKVISNKMNTRLAEVFCDNIEQF